jgi:hypothetical protein
MYTSFKVSITVLTHPRYRTCRVSGLVQIAITLKLPGTGILSVMAGSDNPSFPTIETVSNPPQLPFDHPQGVWILAEDFAEDFG